MPETLNVSKVIEAFGCLYISWNKTRRPRPYGFRDLLFRSLNQDRTWLVDSAMVAFELHSESMEKEMAAAARSFTFQSITNREILAMRLRLLRALLKGEVPYELGYSFGRVAGRTQIIIKKATGIDLWPLQRTPESMKIHRAATLLLLRRKK